MPPQDNFTTFDPGKLDVTGFIKYAKANITSLTVRIEQRDTDGTLIAGAQGTLWDAEVKAAIVDDGAMTKDDGPPEEQPTWGMKLELSPKTGSFKPDQPVNGTAVYTRAGLDPEWTTENIGQDEPAASRIRTGTDPRRSVR